MNSNERLRKMLEPEAPRLSPEAATRLNATVDEALSRRARRRVRGWRTTLVLAPALILLVILVFWAGPFGGGESAPKHLLLSKEEFLAALDGRDDVSGVFDEYLVASLDDMDTNNWNDTDLEGFRRELESFQPADEGGEQ